MTIRPADAGDYPAATALFRVLMGEHFVLDEALFGEVCRGGGHRAFVAEDDSGAVVGIVAVVVGDRIRLAANTRRRRFHIDQLVVLPERRRHGVGRALLDHVVALARSETPSYIIVNCDFTNVAARRTYESAGFQLIRQAADRFEIAFPQPAAPAP
jgi:ribosomal protein S18 acetylase RimI-like enzyme